MTKYICKDEYNGDVVYNGNSRHDLFYAMQDYDYECGGEWYENLYMDGKRVKYSDIFDGTPLE